MKNIEELDGLLKSGMEGFSPTPPDVWNAVAQQVHQVPTTSTSSIWQSIQQASTFIKSAVAIGTSTIIGVAVVYNLPEEKQKLAPQTVVSQSIAVPEIKEEKSTLPEPKPLVQTEKISPVKSVSKLPNSSKETPISLPEPKPELEEQIKIDLAAKKTEIGAENNTEESSAAVNKIPLTENFDSPDFNTEESEQATLDKPQIGNVFTPNGDGKNDQWVIIMAEPKFFHVRVFDKSGSLVFESENVHKHWNGIHFKSGMECGNGSYTFQLDYQYPNQNKVQVVRGILSLIR
ncbi:MAG: gliding motility-associated C-terminal domain-containing protein [Bacteroidia bacterium]